MTIWAIADIHASPLDEEGRPVKPMEVFGERWEGHVAQLEQAWAHLVAEHDTVIIAGDIDWSLHLADATSTLERIHGWPGLKIMVRGNHDYWWSSGATNKVRAILPDSIRLLHNNSYQAESFNIVGCKGSPVPGAPEWTEVEAKLLNRETERLKLSLATRDPSLPSIAALHYPPFFMSSGPSPYTKLFEQSNVKLCVYGHLHGDSASMGAEGMHDSVQYRLVACDHLEFRPVAVAAEGEIYPFESRRAERDS